jgi:hypothetical protein
MADYNRFTTWKKFLTVRESQLDSPFDRKPLGEAPVFLYSETTAPLPCASMAGVWTAYPGVRELAAHLRFGLLPAHFSIWLCRHEWDASVSEPKTAESIFEGVGAAENRYVKDIRLMKQIVAELDLALAAADESDTWRRVQKACRLSMPDGKHPYLELRP